MPPENLAAEIILWGQDGLSAAHTGSQKLLKNACSRDHQAFDCILVSLMGFIQLLDLSLLTSWLCSVAFSVLLFSDPWFIFVSMIQPSPN